MLLLLLMHSAVQNSMGTLQRSDKSNTQINAKVAYHIKGAKTRNASASQSLFFFFNSSLALHLNMGSNQMLYTFNVGINVSLTSLLLVLFSVQFGLVLDYFIHLNDIFLIQSFCIFFGWLAKQWQMPPIPTVVFINWLNTSTRKPLQMNDGVHACSLACSYNDCEKYNRNVLAFVSHYHHLATFKIIILRQTASSLSMLLHLRLCSYFRNAQKILWLICYLVEN